MWRSRYWAVLGMQTLLGITLILASLSLITREQHRLRSLILVRHPRRRRGALLVHGQGHGAHPDARAADPRALDSLTGRAGAEVRLHRDRIGAGRLRRGDPRCAARHEDGGRREEQRRRPLPERGVHPGEGDAARGRGVHGDAARRRLRHRGRGRVRELRRRHEAPRQGGQDADERRGDAVRQEQDRLHRGLRLRHRRRQREDRRPVRRHGDRDRPRDPRGGLGAEADPRPAVRQARARHRRHVASQRAAEEAVHRRRAAPPASRSAPPSAGSAPR